MKFQFKCKNCNNKWEESIKTEKDFYLQKNSKGFFEWQDYDGEQGLPTYRRYIECSCGSRNLELKKKNEKRNRNK